MPSTKEIQRKYYLNHRDKIIETMRQYRISHPGYGTKWAQPHPNHCPDCGNIVSRGAKYCRKCISKHFSPQTPSGTNSKLWKGIQRAKGYILIHKPTHPRANKYGYVSEHIINWEIANNKHIPKGWIIHHLNGIKNDNRPCNLVAMPNKKHFLVLKAKAKRIQELEAMLKNQRQLC